MCDPLVRPLASNVSFFFRPIFAGLVIVLFPACRSLPSAPLQGRGASNTSRPLDQAEQAWHAMQRNEPGTVSAQKKLVLYNQALTAVVSALHAGEGTSAWGQEIQ